MSKFLNGTSIVALMAAGATAAHGAVKAKTVEVITDEQKDAALEAQQANKQHIVADDIGEAIVSIFEPVIAALDIRPGTSNDNNGHNLASQEDRGLQILLGGVIAHLNRQYRGPITTTNGSNIPCALDRVKESESRMAELKARYSDDPAAMQNDANFFTVAYWLNVNQERADAILKLLDGVKSAYHTLVGVEWQPLVAGNGQQTVKPTTAMADALKAAVAKAESRKAQGTAS